MSVPSSLSTPTTPPEEPVPIEVEQWPDPVVDELGHDPRSRYVETFWLGILGPSTTLLLRHLADRFEQEPDGFSLELGSTAAALGLGMKPGRNGPFQRSLERLCQFGLAQRSGSTVRVRRFAPPLTQGQLKRLPPHLQDEHDAWRRSQLGDSGVAETRARQLALTLLEIGESCDAAERQLDAWRIDGPLARRSLAWAADQMSRRPRLTGVGGDAA